jgi:hypothetical protein
MLSLGTLSHNVGMLSSPVNAARLPSNRLGSSMCDVHEEHENQSLKNIYDGKGVILEQEV